MSSPLRYGLVALLLGCFACSAVIDTDKRKLGALPIPCEPGLSVPCPCPDGTQSMQLCNELARYDACKCAALPGTAGAGAAGAAGQSAAAGVGGGVRGAGR